jgi:hypothetical protein
MAEDQAAAGAAAGLAGQMCFGHDGFLQAVPEQSVQGHGSHQHVGEPAASQQPSWQQYNSVFTASKAGAARASLTARRKSPRLCMVTCSHGLTECCCLFRNRHAKRGQGEGEVPAADMLLHICWLCLPSFHASLVHKVNALWTAISSVSCFFFVFVATAGEAGCI